MANVTVERTGLHLRNLFSVLIAADDGLQAKDAVAKTAAMADLTPYEAGDYPSGGRRFDKILRFATVDAVKAGWIAKSKGRWTITEEGREAYHKWQDPREFYGVAKKLYEAWKAERDKFSGDDDPDDDTTVSFEEAEEKAWKEIREYLMEMPPFDFQNLAEALLEAMDYHVAWVAPPGKDGGMDLIAYTDPLGTTLPRIKVQVKRRKDAISSEEMRSFMAVLGHDDVGIFFSAGGFTRDAEREVRQQDRRKLTLLNLEQFFDLWIEHYDALDDDARRLLPLKPIWFLAPGTA